MFFSLTAGGEKSSIKQQLGTIKSVNAHSDGAIILILINNGAITALLARWPVNKKCRLLSLKSRCTAGKQQPPFEQGGSAATLHRAGGKLRHFLPLTVAGSGYQTSVRLNKKSKPQAKSAIFQRINFAMGRNGTSTYAEARPDDIQRTKRRKKFVTPSAPLQFDAL